MTKEEFIDAVVTELAKKKVHSIALMKLEKSLMPK